MTKDTWLTVAIVIGWLTIIAATATLFILYPFLSMFEGWMIPI